MAQKKATKVALDKVIFRFTALSGEVYCNLVPKSYDNETGEIKTGNALMKEKDALVIAKQFDIKIVDLVWDEENERYTKKVVEAEPETK